MKKVNLWIKRFDRKVDKAVNPVWAFVQERFVFFSSTLLLLLLAIFVIRIFQQEEQVLSVVIQDDIARIQKILKRIDVDCNILSIRADRAFVDFFTVKEFAGSTVGPLNLAYPKNWGGPYVRANPSVQGKLYEIVRGKDGYFVVPGHGVELPNDLVMGRDVVITPETLVGDMLKAGGRLFCNDKAHGVKLMFEVGDWDTPRPSKEAVEEISEGLEEITEALPYTYNDKAFGKLPLS